jgi:hypothetical protein
MNDANSRLIRTFAAFKRGLLYAATLVCSRRAPLPLPPSTRLPALGGGHRCPAERERALERYEQLGRQAHRVCQICQEAIRARLHHESIRPRARAQLQHTPPPPVAAVPRSAPAAAAPAAAVAAHTVAPPTLVSPYVGSSTSRSTGSDSYGFPSMSSICSGPSLDPTVSSVSDGTGGVVSTVGKTASSLGRRRQGGMGGVLGHALGRICGNHSIERFWPRA